MNKREESKSRDHLSVLSLEKIDFIEENLPFDLCTVMHCILDHRWILKILFYF